MEPTEALWCTLVTKYRVHTYMRVFFSLHCYFNVCLHMHRTR